jgi:osmotically-inducible protein OsmY
MAHRDRWGDDRDRYGGRNGDLGRGRGGYGREAGGQRADDRGHDYRGYGHFGTPPYGGRIGGEDYGDHDRGGYGGAGYGQGRGRQDRATGEVSSWLGGTEPERHGRADHRGRGPKGYRRSDERIREDVSDRLYDDPYVDASDIEVTVSGGEVSLAGAVDSRETRRRAEDLAEGVSGVTHVQNNLRVRRHEPSGGSGGGHGTGPGVGSGSGAGLSVGRLMAPSAQGGGTAGSSVVGTAASGDDRGRLRQGSGPMDVPPQADQAAAAGPALALHAGEHTVTALFASLAEARRAADHLAGLGITAVAISTPGDDTAGASTVEPGGSRSVWEALAGILMPEEDRRAYVEDARGGGVLLTASVGRGMADEVVRVLERAGARVRSYASTGSDRPT